MRGVVTTIIAAVALSGCGDGGRIAVLSQNVDSLRRLERVDLLAPSVIGFGSIADIQVSGGHIAVADGLNRQIYLFDRRDLGADPVKIGGPGSGPGEFRYPIAVGFDGVEVVVYDESATRLTRFTTDGDLLSTQVVQNQPRYGQRPEAELTVSGDLFALGFFEFQQGLMDNLGSRSRGITRGRNHILRWNPDEGSWEALQVLKGIEVFADLGKGSLSDVAYPQRPLWMPSPDGNKIWFADSGDSIVSVLSWRDGVTRSVRTHFRQFPVPDSLRAAYLNADDVSGRDDNQVRRIRSRRADLPFPDSMPPLLRILPDPDGGVWIFGRSPDRTELRHIGMTGELLASYEVESSFEPYIIRDGLIFGVHSGPLEVQSIGVYSTKQTGETGGDHGMPDPIP